jgi:putative iron-dependent peroxidase
MESALAEYQKAILAPIPTCGYYLSFTLASKVPAHGATVRSALAQVAEVAFDAHRVIGVGPAVIAACGGAIAAMRPFQSLQHGAHTAPSTQDALWIWLRGADRGALLLEARQLIRQLQPVFQLHTKVEAFRYREGRDLSGYVDGTENPQDDAALDAAIVRGSGSHLDGSSFVAVQQWQHDLDSFEGRPQVERDHSIGRTQEDDIEIDTAPPSAHVKRTAQESFDPEAFVLRRSMPWADDDRMGLMFVAFGHSFDAFEVQMRRMLGLDDGIVDALFDFTRPISGAYYWCPPVRNGALELRALDG